MIGGAILLLAAGLWGLFAPPSKSALREIHCLRGTPRAEAKRKGIKLFAITDHGPDMEDAPHHWHFINMRIWPRLVDGV
ncbi:intracellular growth attenuator family protein, partial [Salmonella enterica subsp. enterica serovar Kentucky]|nr:intracellular growth attenuator family protein [Salmonella enterica subsp. enterica serovar Kentucky]